MLVNLSKNDYVEIMSKRPYMDCYSREALEKIYDLEEEYAEGNESKYALDGAGIRGSYTEYDNIKKAMKDLGYDDKSRFEVHHLVFKLSKSVLVQLY